MSAAMPLAAVERVGVTDALPPIAVAQPHDDEFGVGHDAVHGVLHGKRQRQAVQGRFNVCDRQGGFLDCWATACAIRVFGWTGSVKGWNTIVRQPPGGRLLCPAGV